MEKQVLFVSAYLGGYPGLEVDEEYVLFAKLYNEGYTQAQHGDEGGLWVSKHPLPKPGEVKYWGLEVSHEDVVTQLQDLGFEVLDVENVYPEFLPERAR